jgi:hypothetical protein
LFSFGLVSFGQLWEGESAQVGNQFAPTCSGLGMMPRTLVMCRPLGNVVDNPPGGHGLRTVFVAFRPASSWTKRPLDWTSEAISGARLFGPKETGFTVFAWICGTSCLFWCLAPVAGLCALLACWQAKKGPPACLAGSKAYRPSLSLLLAQSYLR